MKFDAWSVEPPGLGSGPLSISSRSSHPSSARCPTRQLPTIPAPITAIVARAGSTREALTAMLLLESSIIGPPVHCNG